MLSQVVDLLSSVDCEVTVDHVAVVGLVIVIGVALAPRALLEWAISLSIQLLQ